MTDKIKLIFFDMEGTIFKKASSAGNGNTAPSAWTRLAEHLGPEALQEEDWTKEKWNNDEYAGYVEWMEDTIKVHQKYGLDRKFFEKVMNSIDYHPNTIETFNELRKRGYKTALISGGFKAQADRALVDLKINHAFAACEYLWDKDGKLVHWNLLPCDYEGKLDFMKLIIKEHGLRKDQCGFVGDGKNDIPFAQAVGVSVAFNGAKELQDISTHSINQEKGKEDFSKVLDYF